MKKIVSILICVCLITVVFSACNKKVDTSHETDDSNSKYEVSELDNNTSINNSSTESFPDTSSKTDISSDVTSLENFNSSKNENSSLPEDSSQTNDVQLEKYELPDYNLDSIYLSKFKENNRYIKVLTEAEINDFNSYANKLIATGFTKYDENKINNCQFMTLINKDTFVSMSYMASEKKIKVVSEPLGALYPRAVDNNYTSIGMQSLFTGMKNQNRPIYSGMGFVIRLDDGSFIIIDGGGGDRNHIDSNNLLNILKEQSPKGTTKPVISAWIFTHCHDDHIGVFNAFSDDFHDQVEIKQIYYSFPLDKDIRKASSFMFDDDYYSYPNFKSIIKAYYSNADIIRPHSGERYYIKNAVIEMLFTYDDHFPNSFEYGGIGNLNTTSLIFTITIGGQKMMITGDAETAGMNIVTKNFGNYIKSDFLQLAHHGQNGTESFYSTVNPKYVLMPISHVDENRVYGNLANLWLVESVNVRQFISFWNQNVTIPLPYNPTDAQIYDRIPNRNTKYYEYPLH